MHKIFYIKIKYFKLLLFIFFITFSYNSNLLASKPRVYQLTDPALLDSLRAEQLRAILSKSLLSFPLELSKYAKPAAKKRRLQWLTNEIGKDAYLGLFFDTQKLQENLAHFLIWNPISIDPKTAKKDFALGVIKYLRSKHNMRNQIQLDLPDISINITSEDISKFKNQTNLNKYESEFAYLTE